MSAYEPPGRIKVEAVSVEEYERIERERDDYRRALALLNMTRVNGSHLIDEPVRSQMDRILTRVGMTWQMGQAVAAVAAEVLGREPSQTSTQVDAQPDASLVESSAQAEAPDA